MTKRLVKCLIVAMLAAVVAVPSLAADEEKKPDWGPAVGQKIQPITLKAVANADGEFNSRELENDTLVVLVSSVCTQCRKEISEISKAMHSFEAKKIDVALALVDVNPEAGAKRLEKYGLAVYADSDFALGTSVDMTVTPSSILLAKDGTIKAKQMAYRKDDYKKFLQ